jgi:hypothetical protein
LADTIVIGIGGVRRRFFIGGTGVLSKIKCRQCIIYPVSIFVSLIICGGLKNFNRESVLFIFVPLIIFAGLPLMAASVFAYIPHLFFEKEEKIKKIAIQTISGIACVILLLNAILAEWLISTRWTIVL